MNREYLEAAESLLNKATEWREDPRDVWGLGTGFECFDIGLGGLHGSELFVLAARPSHGKTTIANQIAYKIANRLRKQEKRTGEPTGKVVLISPEMSVESIIMRQACNISGVSSRSIKTGRATPEEMRDWTEAVEAITELGSHIIVSAGRRTSIADVETLIYEQDTDARFLMVDYITQLVGDGKFRNNHEEVGDFALRLKRIAMDYNIPVMALSQLSRDVEKDSKNKDGTTEERPPVIADLRASGRIEETADVVALLQRKRQSMDSGQYGVPATIEIAKNRDGPVGFITMNFNTRYNRFDDIGIKRGLQLEGL